MARQVAPPKVTGGGGFVFEDKVVAYFLSCLLSGQPPLNPELGTLSRVDFQTRVDGWFLDDILLTLVSHRETRQCALSIKSNQQFAKNAAPSEFVSQAWAQFLHEETTRFDRDRDLLGLVVSSLPPKLAAQLYELLEWADKQDPEELPDRLAVTGFGSNVKRRLFDSFVCPKELAAKHGVGKRHIGALLRCVQVLPFDFEHDPSSRLQAAVHNCRSALRSGSLEEAQALWERLLIIASEHRPHAGFLDFPRLLGQVRSRFQLKDYPNHQADWSSLLARTRQNLATIPDKIGATVSLPRDKEHAALEIACNEKKSLVLLGPSGCGKTVIAKAWAEKRLASTKVLWWNAGSFDVQDFSTFEKSLNLQHSLQELLSATPDVQTYVVIDGLDRVFSEAAFHNTSVLLHGLGLHSETSSWHILITCQPEEWERIRAQLMRVNAPSLAWQVLEVKEPHAEELDPIWSAFPALLPLTRQPQLQSLLLKPKVLDLLATRLSVGNMVDTRQWVGESDLIKWFWGTEIAKSPNASMRSHFLMVLAERQADDLRSEIPSDAFSISDLAPLDGLLQDRICKEYEQRLSFVHDLYGDWARQQKLLAHASNLRAYLEPRLVSPLWYRAVRLYGLHLLEQDLALTRWRAAIEALAVEDKTGSLAQDLLLESVIFAAQPLPLLERLWPDLAANGGLLLHRLLGRFLYVATLPNPTVTAVTKAMIPDCETEAATLYRLPYWPYWLPVLQFLYSHRTEVIPLAPQHITEIASTWLQRGHESWVLRQEAAELALALAEPILHLRQSGRFVHIEDKLVKSAYGAALAGACELPERVAAFALEACARREPPRQESPNRVRTGAIRRHTLLTSVEAISTKAMSPPWPDGPRGHVDAIFRDICLQENILLPLITTAPDVAREVLLALLIKPSRDDVPYRFGSRLVDNPEVERVFQWNPPFYTRGPFLLFLHLHPTEGLEIIVRLVNFATERWATRRVGQKPPGVSMPLPGGETRWIGNHALYYWYRAYPHCPHPVAVALMALEKWLYDAIDAQQPIHDTVNTLLQRSHSVAFAGLLSSIARKEPSLFEGILQPLLAVPEFHHWEWWYSSQPDQGLGPMIGWGNQGTPFIQLSYEWHTLPHRRQGLHERAHDLFLNAPQMRPFFERARSQWIERLQAAQQGDDCKDYLEKLIAQYDVKNYEVQSHPERGEVWEFIPPEALRLKSEKLYKDTEEKRLLLHFPIRCRQILDEGQPLLHDSLEQFWDLLQRLSKFVPPTDDDSEGARVEDALCGGVAVLLKFHRQWLRQHPVREEWCVQQLFTTIRNHPKLGSSYHKITHVNQTWEQFCAQVLPLLWAEAPDSPALRECIALLAASYYHKTVEILFAAIAEHRQHLGVHFKQLQHFLLRWAAARWKWQRFIYKEETRLELEAWRHRAIQAFVTQSIAVEVPPWEEIIVQEQSRQVGDPQYIKWMGGIKKIRFEQDLGLDLLLLQAAYSWLPALKRAASEVERVEWIGFWKEALDCLLRRLGEDVGDEEEICGTPYEVDDWVLRHIACLITQLRRSERPADFWKPIHSLGTPGHSWVKTFLSEWFVYGLHTEPVPDAFVREWRAMLEFAFVSPKWNFDSVKHWFELEEMWCALMGFDWISRDTWTVSQKPVVKHMSELYERWADTHLHRPQCARAFIAFLKQPAAEEILLDGLTWLEKAARRAGDRFWNEHGLQAALVSLLDVCWRSYQGRLRQHEAAFSAFKTLLKKLADFQNSVALEIQQKVVSAHDWPT